MKYQHYASLLLASASLGIGVAPMSALAQDKEVGEPAERLVLEEVVVTARRREELLQDVPISMSVFNQSQISNADMTNPGDLATYTPNMQANQRFGADNTTFAIRGFTQELRTTASVGVYFAEVVALRGANSQQSGDGATPGDLFDLANVQVLKGPQGTLFGRNTTGGAVLLTPNRPTDEFEGYGEVSVGNYDMLRGQAVINLPLNDNFKLRLGVDSLDRDGYLNNISGIGPNDFADSNYTAFRISALWQVTDDIENYTIYRHSYSDNHGYPSSLLYCNPAAPLGAIFCEPDLQNRKANGDFGFYDVYSFVPKPVNTQRQWQAINTTTWEISDDLLVKNILSYGELRTKQRSAIFGTDWTFQGQPLIFQQVGLAGNFPTTNQKSYVEELQFQGSSFDDRLSWQGGLYFEESKPVDEYGAQSPAIIQCDQYSIMGDPKDFLCNDILGLFAGMQVGAVQSVPGGVKYINRAIYGQGTYDFTDEWSLTAGLRYTDDRTKGHTDEEVYYFYPPAPIGELQHYTDVLYETRNPREHSHKPTWMIDVDWKPTDDIMAYAKYSRGYRQGSVNIGGSTGLDTHGPEKVDTYEIGSKTSFYGSMPATLNVALFYNDFTDQQVQFGYFKTTGVGTTAIVNAGSSTIYGAEVEATIQVLDSVILSASYAYLHTHVDDLTFPPIPPNTVSGEPSNTTAEGEPLSFSPENSLVMNATWLLPFSADLGDMKLGATYVFTDSQQAVSKETSKYYELSSYSLTNFNFDWTGIMGSPIDFSAFVTNAFDKQYVPYISGLWNQGFEFGQVGQPRMYGARLRYNF